MIQERKLVDALREVAYGRSRGDVHWGLNSLWDALTFGTSHYRGLETRLSHTQGEAAHLLKLAARIAESAYRRRKQVSYLEAKVRTRLVRLASIENEPDLPARYPFSVRPVIDRATGKGCLKVLGPKNANGYFLIHYAFWIAASALPVETWRAFTPLKCIDCKSEFHDGRSLMRGGRMIRCERCRQLRGSKRR